MPDNRRAGLSVAEKDRGMTNNPGPVVLIHLYLDAERHVTACQPEPIRPASDTDWPDVPRMLCPGCRLSEQVGERIRRLESAKQLADYDLKALNDFKGYRDKTLRYWAKRAAVAEAQLEEAGIERRLLEDGT